jgi:hypothetical protein
MANTIVQAIPADLLERAVPRMRNLSKNRKCIHRRNCRKIEIIYQYLGRNNVSPRTLRLECRVQEKRLRNEAWGEVNRQLPYVDKAKNRKHQRRHLYNKILMRKFEELLKTT